MNRVGHWFEIFSQVQKLMFEFVYFLLQTIIAFAAIGLALRLSQSVASFSSTSNTGFVNFYFDRFNKAGFVYPRGSVRNIVVGVLLVSFLFGVVLSVYLGIVLSLFALAAIWFYLERKAKVNLLKQQNVNDEICYFLARSLRAGYTLEQSISRAGEQFPESRIANQLSFLLKSGYSIAKAAEKNIRESKTDVSSAEKMLCATIALANQMGGNSSRIFDRIGDNFHMCYELLDDTKSELAQVRLSAYLICGLPLVMFAISFLTGSNSNEFLFTNPIGIVCLTLGISLELAGIYWMKSMVKGGVGIWAS